MKLPAGSAGARRIGSRQVRRIFADFLRIAENELPQAARTSRRLVHLFVSSLLADSATEQEEAAGPAVQTFFAARRKEFSIADRSLVTSMYDELFGQVERRFSGDFWTPSVWAAEAADMLAEVLGQNWRQERVVWDPASGTKNLTRDFEDFRELYISTLFQAELDTADLYNQEAQATFQYDFLNDGVTPDGARDLLGLPPSLYRALTEDRPLVFYMNPPFATAANHGETAKATVAKTAINELMNREKLDRSSQQLYAQFLWRILLLKRRFGLTDVTIGMFSNERFLRGGRTWERFMQQFQEDFSYQRGMLFNAGEFSGVASNWGISFTVWRSAAGQSQRPISEFPLELKELTAEGIQTRGSTVARSVPSADLLSHWMRQPLPAHLCRQPEGAFVRLKNATDVSDRSSRGELLVGAIGYAHNNGNSVEHSARYIGLYSTAFGSGNGVSVLPENFERVVVNFATRKALLPAAEDMWIDGHQNFLAPSAKIQGLPEWPLFVGDCLVASLCNPSGSNQSALRKVNYRGRFLDVRNEWFFMSVEQMRQLAERYDFPELGGDSRVDSGERFVYRWLQAHPLSPEAAGLLGELRAFMASSIPIRKTAHSENPAGSFQAWDAGYKQIWMIGRQDSVGLAQRRRAVSLKIRRRAREWGLL